VAKYVSTKPNLLLVTKENSHALFQALHYAQYDMTDKALKKAVITYAKNEKLDHKLLNVLNDKELAFLGKYAYILVAGGELPDSYQAGFARSLDEAFVRAKAVQKDRKAAAKAKAKETAGPVLTVQDRMRMQAEDVCQEFDGWLDDVLLNGKKITKNMDPAKAMTLAGFKAGQARYVSSFYKPELKEMKAVVAGKDEQVKEGYSNIQKSAALRAQKLLESIVGAASMLQTMAKAQRKTRKKKAPSMEKLIGKLKYCESFPDLSIASVSPAGIIGAKEVWVYNTKYRKLGKYVAKDDAGLTVKGTGIKDFNENESRQKTLRKPKEQLAEFNKAGKVALRKFLEDIKAVDAKMNGRMNENIVILKVFK